MWAIIDSKGIIHSGNEDEMRHAMDVIKCPGDYSGEDVEKYDYSFEGDLMLIEIHETYK